MVYSLTCLQNNIFTVKLIATLSYLKQENLTIQENGKIVTAPPALFPSKLFLESSSAFKRKACIMKGHDWLSAHINPKTTYIGDQIYGTNE